MHLDSKPVHWRNWSVTVTVGCATKGAQAEYHRKEIG